MNSLDKFDNKHPFFASSMSRRSFYIHDNQLFGFGSNSEGSIGVKNKVHRFKPFKIPFSPKVRKIVAGDDHTLLITKNFVAYSCGKNSSGQLGLGDRNTREKFTKIDFFGRKKVFDISSGYSHSIWFTNEGIFACGFSRNGTLGIGKTNSRINYVITPRTVLLPKNVKFKNAVAGNSYSIFLSISGKIYKTGTIFYGDATRTSAEYPENFFEKKKLIVISHAGGWQQYMCLTASGKLYSIGSNSYGELGLHHKRTQTTFQEVTFFRDMNVQQFAYGFHHGFVLCENGNLFSFGYNTYGQLGYTNQKLSTKEEICPKLTNTPKRAKYVYPSGSHSFYIDVKNRVWCCGENHYGELGVENVAGKKFTMNENIPELIPVKGNEEMMKFTSLLYKNKKYVDVKVINYCI